MEKINNVVKSLTAPEDTHALWLNPEDNSLKAFNFRNGWVSIAGSGGGEFPTDYAKQGGNPEATLSATQVAVGALLPVAQAAEAYNTGKVQLATNITAKGVQASASETLPELASKVMQISQQPIIWDESEVGDQYAAQLFGDGALWNLYEVLKDCKNTFLSAAYEHDGNMYNYKALIICEYYKGYDSLELKGADAYYTCDGDFYNYANPIHVWHDFDNGKANRWVAFLYVQEGSSFEIRNTAISPRAMYIGGHIGTIEYFVNGRLTDLVCGVEETDIIDNFLQKGFAQAFGLNTIIRNVKSINAEGNSLCFVTSSKGAVILDNIGIVQTSTSIAQPSGIFMADEASYIKIAAIDSLTPLNTYLIRIGCDCVVVDIPRLTHSLQTCLIYGGAPTSKLQVINAPELTSLSGNLFYGYTGIATPDLIDIIVGGFTSNLSLPNWNPTNVLADADKKAQLIENIKNHILARVSDATGGTQLVFTISTNMYNEVASETIIWNDQTMTLADAFLTKNWLLAGA